MIMPAALFMPIRWRDLIFRVPRTIAGLFHHIGPLHADLYFHEIGFRWSQRIVTGKVIRRSRRGGGKVRVLWERISPALQLLQVFCAAIGRQMRRAGNGGLTGTVTLTSRSDFPAIPAR